MKNKLLNLILFCTLTIQSFGMYLFLPMNEEQTNHLKAYGFAYWVLQKEVEAYWLLNYKGGSFMFKYSQSFENELIVRGIKYQVISDAQSNSVLSEIAAPDANMDAMKLEKPPKIAVYSPKTKQPWDDAVTMVLTYAEIPYTVIFDEEILKGELPTYDWLHLHHEDFTGQYGKFYSNYHAHPWYQKEVQEAETMAQKFGFNKVSKLKLAVAKKIREFVTGGGFLFAMCAATDTYDIALSADEVDICEQVFDGDPADPMASRKLNFTNTFAFKDFSLITDPMLYEYSNIDSRPNIQPKVVEEKNDYFQLFQFSAKWDPVPTMLTQNHENNIKGFMGQTTAFRKSLVKADVLIMGENKQLSEARYIHGTFGKGFWTFYGGHDPEDYEHYVYEEPTDLNLHPNSPGFRLILNNILFPAAKKKKQKT
ncbi:MAG: asparagine synthetase B [Bacteroidota bacterium]|nr:asparagine synthetase B [Bacteroidota bacterium]